MLLYLLPLFFAFLTPFTKELAEKRWWRIVYGVALCLFMCFGYMTGSDWRVYEEMYTMLDFDHFYYGYTWEPMYYLYMWIFRKLGIGFWPFFVFTKVVIFAILYRMIFDYCRKTGFLTLGYFIPWFGYYLFIDNPMRNCIALAIVLISMKYVCERKFWKFLLLCLLAGSFHFTALIMIPFYWLLTKNVLSWIYLVLFIAINVIFYDRDMLEKLITAVCSGIPYLNNKIVTYFLMGSNYVQGKVFSLGFLWHILVFFLLLYNKRRIVSAIGGTKGLLVYNGAILYLLLLRFTLSIEILMRFQLYFSLFLAIAIGLLIFSFEYYSRVLWVVVVAAISFYTCISKVTGSSRYIPYSNCIPYAITGKTPSYTERYMYNFKQSPYLNDEELEEEKAKQH